MPTPTDDQRQLAARAFEAIKQRVINHQQQNGPPTCAFHELAQELDADHEDLAVALALVADGCAAMGVPNLAVCVVEEDTGAPGPWANGLAALEDAEAEVPQVRNLEPVLEPPPPVYPEDGKVLWTFFGVPAAADASLIPIMATSEQDAVGTARAKGWDLTPGTMRFRDTDWSGYRLPDGKFFILRRCDGDEETSAALAEVPSVAAIFNTLEKREPLRNGPFWMFLQVPITRHSKVQASEHPKIEDALADLRQRCQLKMVPATVGLVTGREVDGYIDQKRRTWVCHYIRDEAEGEAWMGSIPDALAIVGIRRRL